MKNSKRITLYLSLLLIGFAVGCVTSPTGQSVIDPDKIAKLVPALQSSVSGVVVYAYMKDHNSVKYLSLVRTALNEFILSSDLSANALKTKINALPVKELHTAEAQLLITPIISAYKAYGEQYVRAGVDPNAGLRLLVKALVDGISDGEGGIAQITP